MIASPFFSKLVGSILGMFAKIPDDIGVFIESNQVNSILDINFIIFINIIIVIIIIFRE